MKQWLISAGGRKFIFGMTTLLLLSGALGFDYITGQQYVSALAWLIPSVTGSLAAEGMVRRFKNGGK